jgi:hypothetical protein
MRMWMMAGAATVAGGGAWLGGAFDRGEYYPMAPTAVEARLAGLQLGSEAGDFNGESDLRLVLRSRGPALLRWDIMAGGDRLAEVRANLAPENAGTRVEVEFQFTDGDTMVGMDEDPLVNEMAQIAMSEKIDSALEGRAFNVEMVQAKMAAAVASNPQGLVTMQKTLQDNVANELESIERDRMFDPAYSPPPKPGKPVAPPDFSETHADGGWGKNN